jgi:hypothetical protein
MLGLYGLVDREIERDTNVVHNSCSFIRLSFAVIVQAHMECTCALPTNKQITCVKKDSI